MNQECRFCGRKEISVLFPTTKIKNYKKSSEDYACTSCSFGIHGPIVKCAACGLIYVDENPSQDNVSTYYEIADDPLYFAQQEARKITFQKYLTKLTKKYAAKGKLLDIGTNTGLFVKLALTAGWKATGLEPNKGAVEYAKKHYNINIVNRPFEKGAFTKGTFDVITMWDVIEHFTNPIEEISKVYWYLKPGGVFAFSTTDPESFVAKIMGTRWPWYMEMHRVFFSHHAANYYLKKAGFTRVVFSSHWRNLSLGYLATRLQAINPTLAKIAENLFAILKLSDLIVPYYANDLYDCYAYK